MYPFIHIAGRDFGTYGICAVLGLAASVLCVWLLRKRHGISFEDTILLLLVAAGGMLFGGSLLYGITHTGDIVEILKTAGDRPFADTVKGIVACFGGMVFYGGFIGSVLALRLFGPRIAKGEPLGKLLDLYTLTVPLFHAFGRVGCFLGGCCFGIESRFGFITYDNPLSPALNGVRRFPVQLLESSFNLVIFLTLLAVYRSGKQRGKLVYLYMLIYPPVRFGLEFLRGDAIRGFLFGLSTSQWISIMLLTFAACALLYKRKKEA